MITPDEAREEAALLDGWLIGSTSARIIRDLAQQVEDLQGKNERMKEFIEYTAQCPCCTEKEVCHEECTFEHDCPQYYETMQQAREAMK